MDFSSILTVVAVIAGAILLLKILTKPIKLVFKLLLHAVGGFVLLWVVNFFGAGISATFLHCVIAGALGIPGVVLLLILR